MFQQLRFACAFAQVIGPQHFFEKFAQRLVQILIALPHGLVRFPSVAFKYE
jgi:hypothetical protein